jgi:hypothetical protein
LSEKDEQEEAAAAERREKDEINIFKRETGGMKASTSKRASRRGCLFPKRIYRYGMET